DALLCRQRNRRLDRVGRTRSTDDAGPGIGGCRQPRQVALDRRRTLADGCRSGHRRVHPEQRARGADRPCGGVERGLVESQIDLDRVTSDALKSIESRGQAFSQSLLGQGADVARTITTAGEMASNAVNKSLKELEQASRAAIDQSRQVSTAAVTEMQETSKIL